MRVLSSPVHRTLRIDQQGESSHPLLTNDRGADELVPTFRCPRPAATLGLDVADTIRIRAEVLRAAVASFGPDLLIVDKHPRGFRGELEGALSAARRSGAKVVLGVRDVLDEPQAARGQWHRDRGELAATRPRTVPVASPDWIAGARMRVRIAEHLTRMASEADQ